MLYTDPGSGVLLWQILVAGAIGTLFYVRKIFSFFRVGMRPRRDVDPLAGPKIKDQ